MKFTTNVVTHQTTKAVDKKPQVLYFLFMDIEKIIDKSPENPLEKAIQLAHGQTALARMIGRGVKQGHVWAWLNRDGKVPAEHCRAIEYVLDGAVTAEELRPDVFYAPPVPGGNNGDISK
jgi:DNA-binding transcriptional regulator YdaS (Cro superfamily)